ncbi:hypothetical protein PACTADRAFT_49045 [Pachysolen tannophilus NRRL Y-2460]|uniref:Uncharacterized protein n=1 Tax=Pachysolen tannophilus NRRL Y-2460 TaxID=669874 RepID=A0A1E4TZY2_PACTA|nr:hypothetical protein PACTADRAFT_49045 [Pachysolen tannophilus NRRL Y-2460]
MEKIDKIATPTENDTTLTGSEEEQKDGTVLTDFQDAKSSLKVKPTEEISEAADGSANEKEVVNSNNNKSNETKNDGNGDDDEEDENENKGVIDEKVQTSQPGAQDDPLYIKNKELREQRERQQQQLKNYHQSTSQECVEFWKSCLCCFGFGPCGNLIVCNKDTFCTTCFSIMFGFCSFGTIAKNVAAA